MSTTAITQLHTKIIQQRQLLRLELDRLGVRLAVIIRCRVAVLAQKNQSESEDDAESIDDITADLDALEYDLTTFRDQLRDRLLHLEQGIRLLSIQTHTQETEAFYQYVLDSALLAVRDATVARAGYDELIANIKEISQLRGQ